MTVFLVDCVPAPFNNLDRFKVRKLVIEKLNELSLLEKEEKYHISVPRGERSNVVIEPKLSHQWYVKTAEMAARANKAVNNGDIKFHPQNLLRRDELSRGCENRWIRREVAHLSRLRKHPDHKRGEPERSVRARAFSERRERSV